MYGCLCGYDPFGNIDSDMRRCAVDGVVVVDVDAMTTW